jgi:ketopantoate reductase
VIIQNGVGNETEFRRRFPETPILSGVVRGDGQKNVVHTPLTVFKTWVKADQPEPGLVIHSDNETMQFGCAWSEALDKSRQQSALDRFVKLLSKGGTQIELVSDIGLWRWKKTIWSVRAEATN